MTTMGPLNFLVIPKQHNRPSIHLFSIRTSPALRFAGVAGASQVFLGESWVWLWTGGQFIAGPTSSRIHTHTCRQSTVSKLHHVHLFGLWEEKNPLGEDAKHHTERPRGSNPHTSWFVITVLSTAQAESPRNKVMNNQIQG